MGLDGIFLGQQSRVEKVHAANNGRDGIQGSQGSTISGNTAYQNGGDGIFAGTGSTVSGNTVRSNGGYGLNLIDAAYRGNTISDNTIGTVNGGVNAGGNVCNGSLTCP